MNIPEDKRVEVLQALYREAFVAPAAIMFGSAGPPELSVERARAVVNRGYIDYLDGHAIKMDLTADEVSTHLYDRDGYPGKAEKIIRGIIG